MPGWQESKLRQAVPSGKYRVIGVDLFAFEEYLVKDCAARVEAVEIADKRNTNRQGKISDVFYVYNDRGEYIRGINPETGIVDSD